MASEYLKWKYRDEKPTEIVELTPAQKRANWWYYHKWHVLFGIIGTLLLGNFIIEISGVFKTKPDLQVAVVSEHNLSDNDLNDLQERLIEIAGDYNLDGKVTVKINVYAFSEKVTGEAAYMGYASEVALLADLEENTSFLFFLEDADAFQNRYEILSYVDGTNPESFENAEGCTVPCRELSLFDNLSSFQSFTVSRRGFWTKKTVKYYEGCVSLWNSLTDNE